MEDTGHVTGYVERVPGSRNIILTGFMGTGKTTVGRLLAQRLGKDFVDTDQLIKDRYGPIETIFANEGEGRFREMEGLIAVELAEESNTVIATGGGMLVDETNASALSATGEVVCLTASMAELRRRLTRTGKNRPLLSDPDSLQRLLEERRAAYARFSQIDTTDLSPTEVADAVTALLNV